MSPEADDERTAMHDHVDDEADGAPRDGTRNRLLIAAGIAALIMVVVVIHLAGAGAQH
jgi:hypothetical protein